MKLIEPSFEIIEQQFGNSNEEILNNLYKHIELCARTCYKSEDKITDDSAKEFVDRLIKSGHTAMLEHGTVYMKWILHDREFPDGVNPKYSSSVTDGKYKYITTNLRVIVENDKLKCLVCALAPKEHHIKRHTVKFICNRQVSHEFVRHRKFSFAMESTRYCNYSKGKFGGELTFIKPCWFTEQPDLSLDMTDAFYETEKQYLNMIANGWKPEQAATILPNALKTELVMTGFDDDWKHFFNLRALGTTGKPHPQAQELAVPLMKEFESRKYI